MQLRLPDILGRLSVTRVRSTQSFLPPLSSIAFAHVNLSFLLMFYLKHDPEWKLWKMLKEIPRSAWLFGTIYLNIHLTLMISFQKIKTRSIFLRRGQWVTCIDLFFCWVRPAAEVITCPCYSCLYILDNYLRGMKYRAVSVKFLTYSSFKFNKICEYTS